MHDDVVSGGAGATPSKLHISHSCKRHVHVADFHEAIDDGRVCLQRGRVSALVHARQQLHRARHLPVLAERIHQDVVRDPVRLDACLRHNS